MSGPPALPARGAPLGQKPTRARLRALGAAILAATSSLRRVEWSLVYVGFLGYTFAITTYRLPIGVWAMVLGLVGLVLQRSAPRFPPVVAYYGLFLFWAVLGVATAWTRSVTVETLINQLKVYAILLVAVNALRSRAQIRFFMVFMLGCFATHPARGTIINYLTGNADFGRAAWNYIYANPNDMAALALLQLSIAVALVMTEPKGLIRLGALASVAVLPVVILLTQSRGVFLGLAAFVLLGISGQQRRLRAFGTVLLLAAAAVLVSPQGVWKRVEGLANATSTANLREVDKEGSAAQRYAIWRVGSRVIASAPIMGVGIGGYAHANATFSTRLGARDAHSTYITVLAESGLPGILLFLAFLGTTIGRAERVRRRCRQAIPSGAQQLRYLELGLIGFLVAGIFGSYDKLALLYVHIALIWGLAATCERELRQAAQLALRGQGGAPLQAPGGMSARGR